MIAATLSIPTARFAAMRSGLMNTQKPLEDVGHYVVEKWMPALFKSSGLGTWPAVGRGGQPLWDTGTLARGFSWNLGGDAKSVLIVNPLKYAALQNFGGTVSAKGGKFLAIPLPTLSVTERRSKKPREFSNTFFAKSRKGNLILFEKVSKGKKGQPGEIRPLFVMKTSVTIKPRPFMKWFDPLKVEVNRIVRESILTAMKAA